MSEMKRLRPRLQKQKACRANTEQALVFVTGRSFGAAYECVEREAKLSESWWVPVVNVAALLSRDLRQVALEASRGSEVLPYLLLYSRLHGRLLGNASYLMDGVPPQLPVAVHTQSMGHVAKIRTNHVRASFKPMLDRARGSGLLRRGALQFVLSPFLDCLSVEGCEALVPQTAELPQMPAVLRCLCVAVQVLVAFVSDSSGAGQFCFRADCGRTCIPTGTPSARIKSARVLPWVQFASASAAEQQYWRRCAFFGEKTLDRTSICSSQCLRLYCAEVQRRVPFEQTLTTGGCGPCTDLAAEAERLFARNDRAARHVQQTPRLGGHLPSSHVAQLRRMLLQALSVDALLVYAGAVLKDARRQHVAVRALCKQNWRRGVPFLPTLASLSQLLRDMGAESGRVPVVRPAAVCAFSQKILCRVEVQVSQLF